MSDILVTGVQSSGSGEHPVESVSIQFAKIDVEYTPGKTGRTPRTGIHFVFDLKTSKEG